MHLLVVGGAGYIGSVTVAEALAAGHRVTVYDSLVTGHRAAVSPGARFVQGDFGDAAALDRVLSEDRPDGVVFYGGFIAAGESMEKPGLYFANNVSGVITLLNALVDHGVRRFVFSSSAAVYGDPETLPIPEDALLAPTNPYAETKVVVERLLAWYDSRCGLRSVSLRYFNAAGAIEGLGEDHRPETHLIPMVLQVALGRRPAVDLYGTDYPTSDGTCIRDYVHVVDLARAHLLALARCDDLPAGQEGERRLQPGQRPRLLQPPGHRGGPARHRPAHPGAGVPPARRRPRSPHRQQREGPSRAGMGAPVPPPGGHDRERLALAPGAPRRLSRVARQRQETGEGLERLPCHSESADDGRASLRVTACGTTTGIGPPPTAKARLKPGLQSRLGRPARRRAGRWPRREPCAAKARSLEACPLGPSPGPWYGNRSPIRQRSRRSSASIRPPATRCGSHSLLGSPPGGWRSGRDPAPERRA